MSGIRWLLSAWMVFVAPVFAPPHDPEAGTVRDRSQHASPDGTYRAERDDHVVDRLRKDLADGTLDEFPLFDAAVIAGGVNDPRHLAKLRSRFESVCRSAAPEIERHSGASDRLNAVLACLHRELLTGKYRADYSELHRTLDDGHFNCVSSTILFRCLCERFDIACHAVASRDHVLCCQSGRPRLYIETTCRDCFASDIAHQPERVRNFLELEESRDLTDVQLLGKIDYNRGVECLASRRFAEAVSLLQSARELDPNDRAARANLLAALNNWALSECDSGRYQPASDLILQAQALDPGYPPMLVNDLHIHQRWVKSLCDKRRFSEAVTILEAARRRRPDVELFDRGQWAVYGVWAQSHFVAGEFVSGWQILEQALGNLDESAEVTGLAESAVWGACRELLDHDQREQAMRLIDQALERLPASDELIRHKRDLLHANS